MNRTTDLTDYQLIESYKNGNCIEREKAFSILLSQYQMFLYKKALKMYRLGIITLRRVKNNKTYLYNYNIINHFSKDEFLNEAIYCFYTILDKIDLNRFHKNQFLNGYLDKYFRQYLLITAKVPTAKTVLYTDLKKDNCPNIDFSDKRNFLSEIEEKLYLMEFEKKLNIKNKYKDIWEMIKRGNKIKTISETSNISSVRVNQIKVKIKKSFCKFYGVTLY